MENAKWWEPDENDILHIPDELDAIFNKVGTQLRFHTISGKSEALTVAHIVRNCQEFFGAELQKHKDLNKELVDQLQLILNVFREDMLKADIKHFESLIKKHNPQV